MQRYEYKVVPAPQKGTKARGVKTPEGRFANSIEQLLNLMGQDGWEYQRAELLPSEERTGLTGSAVNWRNVLVFRRAVQSEAAQEPVAADEPDSAPMARPVPGPEAVMPDDPAPVTQEVTAPAPIAEEVNDPPLTLKEADSVDAQPGDDSDPKT